MIAVVLMLGFILCTLFAITIYITYRKNEIEEELIKVKAELKELKDGSDGKDGGDGNDGGDGGDGGDGNDGGDGGDGGDGPVEAYTMYK